MKWWDWMPCVCIFGMLNVKPAFSLSSFTFIKRFFSSSLLFSSRVLSSAYLRLLIFLLAFFILACASSRPAFLMMYSVCKLNKQEDNIQPCHTLFPIWNQAAIPCSVLTIASWPAYRFLKRQVRWSSIPISLRIFQFVVIHSVKGFGIVNKAEMKFKKNKPIKLNIQKTKIMASIPITSWQIDGEAMEIVTDFIFGGSKLTADGD